MNVDQTSSYLQTLQQSSNLFRIYFSILENMCLARYEWTGLPEAVNGDDIERLLFLNGRCSIAAMRDAEGRPIKNMIYALPYSSTSTVDAYGYPIEWRTAAPAPTINYDANQQSGVCVFANMSSVRWLDTPDYIKCMTFAGELEDIALARRVNRNATKTPFILKVPSQLKKDAEAILNKIEGNQQAVLGVKDLGEIINIEVLKTDASYMVEEYVADEKNIWDRAFFSLGISSLPFKQERMIEDEVTAQDESTNLVELSNLKERRRAAAHINALFDCDWAVHPSRIPAAPNFHMFDDTPIEANEGGLS